MLERVFDETSGVASAFLVDFLDGVTATDFFVDFLDDVVAGASATGSVDAS